MDGCGFFLNILYIWTACFNHKVVLPRQRIPEASQIKVVSWWWRWCISCVLAVFFRSTKQCCKPYYYKFQIFFSALSQDFDFLRRNRTVENPVLSAEKTIDGIRVNFSSFMTFLVHSTYFSTPSPRRNTPVIWCRTTIIHPPSSCCSWVYSQRLHYYQQ